MGACGEAWGHGGMGARKRGSGEAGELYDKTEHGAYIIDIGAVSTRPGAAEVSADEEKRRLVPVLKKIREEHPELLFPLILTVLK